MLAVGCFSTANKRQKIKILTDNKKTSIYVDKVKVGTGKSIKASVYRNGAQNVVIQTPGFLDENRVLIPKISGRFPGENEFSSKYKIQERSNDQKYLRLTAINFEFKDVDKAVNNVVCFLGNSSIEESIAETEKKINRNEERHKAIRSKDSIKGRLKEYLEEDEEEKEAKFYNLKFQKTLSEYLNKCGFIDTISDLFYDEYNTVMISTKIDEIKEYTINTSGAVGCIKKIGLAGHWYLRNVYNEIIDSFPIREYSGEISCYPYNSKNFDHLIEQNLLFSLHALLEDERVKDYLKYQNRGDFEGEPLIMNKPTKLVNQVTESGMASVIIKRSDEGHGSGFAISNDGYILTNYHVIADRVVNEQSKIKVITFDEKELEAEIVRFNKSYDIALLKVDHQFEGAFELPMEKNFKKLSTVYTIGAPASIELGHSISKGLLSTERHKHKVKSIQLSMPINPGNSGGPVFDQHGSLLGVVKSKLIGIATEGVGFAIPAYLVAEQLKISY